MDWPNVLSIPPNELTSGVLEAIPHHLSSIDANELSLEELKQFFELNRFLINKLINDVKQNNTLKKDLCVNKKSAKSSDTDESYYIQTIQELNREIAQHVFNKNTSNENDAVHNTDTDSLQLLPIEIKKDLLYKIHVKNKYIKRLLSENEMLKEEIDRQKEQVLILNVSLKQTTHRLTKAIDDLSEQKTRNHMTTDDMANLHDKINSVREQMTQIEHDKQKYKQDILYLGDEIQKKINQWNELLKKKYSNECQSNDKTMNNINNDEIKNLDNIVDIRTNEIDANQMRYDENRFEMNVLSKAINKRNLIITEMESLLIDLTMEISQSAVVINRIIKNLSKRETNFTSNLEKLRNHLAKLLERPNTYEHETQTDSPEVHQSHKLVKRRTSNNQPHAKQ